MRELPILFSGEMVRAILEDRKTQTRRTHGLELVNEEPDAWTYLGFEDGLAWFKRHWIGQPTHVYFGLKIRSDGAIGIRPRYEVGDHLWVKETHRIEVSEDINHYAQPEQVFYRADMDDGGKWRPPIHMPKWAARLWREVTRNRAQRLQDISEEDALAEGFESVDEFLAYFDKKNKKRGYGVDVNPWVFPYDFKRIER